MRTVQWGQRSLLLVLHRRRRDQHEVLSSEWPRTIDLSTTALRRYVTPRRRPRWRCDMHRSICRSRHNQSVTLIGPNSCLWVRGAEDIEGVIAVQPKYTRPSFSPDTPTTRRLFSAAGHATSDLDVSESLRMVDSPRHDLMNGILSTLVFHFHHSSSYATLTFGSI